MSQDCETPTQVGTAGLEEPRRRYGNSPGNRRLEWRTFQAAGRILLSALIVALAASLPGRQAFAQTSPSLSINDVTVSEGVSGGNATFTITLSETISADLSVDHATSIASGDTAEVADFTATNGTATIDAGETTATFSVPIVDDTIYEAANDTFTVTLSNVQVSGVTVTISQTTAKATITDDDSAPTLSVSVNNASIAEDGGTSTVTVSTGTGSTFEAAQTITLTLGGTATETSDYTIDSKTLTLPAGMGTTHSEVTTELTGVDDIIDEADEETVLVDAVRATGETTTVAVGEQQTVNVTDDDDPPVLQFSTSAVQIGEDGGVATLTVTTGSSLDTRWRRATSASDASGRWHSATITAFSSFDSRRSGRLSLATSKPEISVSTHIARRTAWYPPPVIALASMCREKCK